MICSSFEIMENINMNSNPDFAGRQTDGHESPFLQKGRHKMTPTPTRSPTCKGDASPVDFKQKREIVQRVLEKHELQPKTTRRSSRIPIKSKDFQSKSDVSVNSVDKALQTLQAASKRRHSKIPVRIKDHKCCNCRFNDFLYNLRQSLRRLRHLEDVRLQNLLARLQDQSSKVTAVSESLRTLGDMEKSLKILQTVSTLRQTEGSSGLLEGSSSGLSEGSSSGLSDGSSGLKFPFSTDVDSAEPMRDDRTGDRCRDQTTWKTNWLKFALPLLLVVVVTVWREYLSEMLCPDKLPDCYLF